MKQKAIICKALIGLTVAVVSCDGNSSLKVNSSREPDAKYVGQAVGNFSASEWFPGGELGTTDNVTAGCYEDETPSVTLQGLETAFNLGEAAFERKYTTSTAPFKGLGPAYLRSSCLDCHPGYGHGKRQSDYRSEFGNGYLLVIYHPVDGQNSDDGPYVSEVTGMPQTKASYPFLPPVDEEQIVINWVGVTEMESGLPMKFPDGEEYSLIYPEVTIPASAFHTSPTPYETGAVAFRLESTIGIIGSGLLDAISQDSIREQYRSEAAHAELNPAFWDKEANDFAPTAWYTLAATSWWCSGLSDNFCNCRTIRKGLLTNSLYILSESEIIKIRAARECPVAYSSNAVAYSDISQIGTTVKLVGRYFRFLISDGNRAQRGIAVERRIAIAT